MTFKIRALAAGDRQRWEPLWQGYLSFYKSSLPDAVSDETFRRLVAPGGDLFGAAAVGDDGRFGGIVHWLFHATTWAMAPTCYLQDLYVVPETRGQGLGAALINHVYAAADERGAAEVYWHTQEFNATARRLYDRIGRLTPFIQYRR
jgi:GNAT superfamily N-acetyltransferase